MEDTNVDGPPVAVMIDDAVAFADGEEADEGEEQLPHGVLLGAVAVRHDNDVLLLEGQREDPISPLLNDMIKMQYTCTSLLSGWSTVDEQCTKRVEQCRMTPEQAMFRCSRSRRTPLHEACLRNACIHVIRSLVAANENGPVDRDVHGNTALHMLFISHSPMTLSSQEMDSIVQVLLADKPTRALAANRQGDTPLHTACAAESQYMSPAVLRRILAARPDCASKTNDLGQTPLHVYCRQPPARTSVEVARILLDAHVDAATALDVAGRTPLHHAAHMGSVHLVCLLTKESQVSVHARVAASMQSGPHLQTPLYNLCCQKLRQRHIPAVQALLEAAPETVTMADRERTSPLHVICKSKKPLLQVVQMLVDSNPGVASMTDLEGYTALHYACEYQAESAVVECLLAAFPRAASVITRKQDTALHLACSANDASTSETVQLLIQANPAALTMANDYGFTPLHCVCRAYMPRACIVQAIVKACPECVTMKTHGGETAMHLACSSGAHVGVLKLLAKSQSATTGGDARASMVNTLGDGAMANKIGDTPLHEACFRGAGYERIETLAKSCPEWIMCRNNAGYTPLQVLCKGGGLDERVVTTFARCRGPQVFSVADETGHTPLHSASRDGTDLAAIRSLIRAYPEALRRKTVYGDTPLHLAVLRRASMDVVGLITEESSADPRSSPLLERNRAGQSVIDIAMESFQSTSGNKEHVFDVLAMLIKLFCYGPSREGNDDRPRNLVRACLLLHRQGVHIDPSFIRQAITRHPEDVKCSDDDGSYPLHIEASIPVEKMLLLDSSTRRPGSNDGASTSRSGILELLIETHPDALRVRNTGGDFPLSLMIRSGRPWNRAFAVALRTFPPALHWYQEGLSDGLMPFVLERASKHCGADTLYQLLVSRPSIVTDRALGQHANAE